MYIVSFPRLKNADILGLVNSVITKASSHKQYLKEKSLQDLLNITKYYEQFRIHINNSRRSKQTSTLNKLDIERNKLISEIKANLSAALKSYNENKQTKAKILKDLIDGFKNFSTLRLDAKSAAIKSLLKDIKNKAGASAAVEFLNLADIFERLDDVNEEFDELYLQRVDDALNQEKYPEAKSLLQACYKNFITSIEAEYHVFSDENIAKLIIFIEKLHYDYKPSINKIKKPLVQDPKIAIDNKSVENKNSDMASKSVAESKISAENKTISDQEQQKLDIKDSVQYVENVAEQKKESAS